jgi:predicted permease
MRLLREWIRRLLGTLHRQRSDADLQEELRAHMELAAKDAQRRGEPARAARLHTGGAAQAMDALRDQRGWPWLQSVFADVRFACRQLNKHRTATVAAILSLGLAVGATTAAFRLLDAVFWRPLPIVQPERFFALGWSSMTSRGESTYRDDFDYPTFRRYRSAVGAQGDVFVVGTSSRQEIVIGTELERASRQYMSGNVFQAFGLRPVIGRLLRPADDKEPRGHDVAVISYDYWSRRFGRDPGVIGRTFRWGRSTIEIVGVAPQGFTGTEPGRLTDFFVPATLNDQALDSPGWSWFRIWVRPADGASLEQVRQLLQAQVRRDRQESVKSLPSSSGPILAAYLNEQIELESAKAGVSGLQRTFRRPMFILGGLVVLVLLIACANVANLMVAQGVARAHEMALRVSIGAGRWRLMQLVLIEGALLAVCASIAGAVFAWWAAPFVISLLAFEPPVQLVLNVDWRVLAFGVALTITVTALFGLVPALRVSSVTPLGALKHRDERSGHRRIVRSLVGAQMAFCLFVVFIAGLFAVTLRNLSNRPLGFEPDHLAVLEINVTGGKQPAPVWADFAERIRSMPGVEAAAFAMWVPLSENRWRAPVSTDGSPASELDRAPYFLGVSPGYFSTMRIGLVEGRDFRAGEEARSVEGSMLPVSAVGIVNEAFARTYFDGQSPVGRRVLVRRLDNDTDVPMEIVGLVRNSAYYNVREAMHATVYVPNDARTSAALVVRTTGDPLALAPTLRRGVTRLRADFRVTNVGTQTAFVQQQLVRERLLATLSLFFAAVALLLAAVGLYGVLNYAVIQRRREIGVRMALGARAAHVVRRVTAEMLSPVGIGAIVGLAGGVAFGRLVQSILFEVKATDVASVATPLLALAVAAVLAALPPALRAVRIDAAQTLRSE